MTPRRTLALAAGVLLPITAAAQPTGDPAAGHRLAATICQTCHGMNGLPKQPEMPTIAAADPAYLVRQLQAYRDGTRQNELMSAVAPMLDDQKMADVAAYYAAIKVTAQPP